MSNKSAKKSTSKINPYAFALRMEVNSVNMYLKYAAQTSSVLGKKLFYSLACEEVGHARKVDELFLALSVTEQFEISGKRIPSLESELKGFFLENQLNTTRQPNEQLSGYIVAMKKEKESYALYEKYYSSAKTKGEKDFFRQLMSEEKNHYEALANVYSYLSNTDTWLREDESMVWNWMNL